MCCGRGPLSRATTTTDATTIATTVASTLALRTRRWRRRRRARASMSATSNVGSTVPAASCSSSGNRVIDRYLLEVDETGVAQRRDRLVCERLDRSFRAPERGRGFGDRKTGVETSD